MLHEIKWMTCIIRQQLKCSGMLLLTVYPFQLFFCEYLNVYIHIFCILVFLFVLYRKFKGLSKIHSIAMK